MDVLSPQFGLPFYALTLVISGGLFFLFRRAFRQWFASETVVLLATVAAAVVATPLVLLALLYVLARA